MHILARHCSVASKEFNDFYAMLNGMYKVILNSLLIFMVLSLPQQIYATVYKWTDSSGRIHFSDSPHASEKTQQIQISPLNTYQSPSQEKIKETLSRPTGAALPKSKVIVYSAVWCGVCKTAKRWLRKKKIAFREYDIEKSERGRRDYKKMKGTGVPIIKIGKKRFNGFSSSRLTPALRKAGYNL